MFFTNFFYFLEILKFSLGKPVSPLNQSIYIYIYIYIFIYLNEQKARKHRKYFLHFPKIKTQPLLKKKNRQFIDILYYKTVLKAKLYYD